MINNMEPDDYLTKLLCNDDVYKLQFISQQITKSRVENPTFLLIVG